VSLCAAESSFRHRPVFATAPSPDARAVRFTKTGVATRAELAALLTERREVLTDEGAWRTGRPRQRVHSSAISWWLSGTAPVRT
jgi:hypothetical protein